tara:strand:- start:220 stop:417 length:198 start_codon:yes stop_codon:yes gene_type:complete
MSKKNLREGFLDTALKGVLGVYFGGKLIDRIARKQAMKDPKVKARVADLKKAIADFDAVVAKYEK